MRCKHCNSTWNTSVEMTICPFCSKSLKDETEYTISSALKQIIEDNTIEILKTPKKVNSYLLDYVQNYDREKKLFKIACECGLLGVIIEIYNTTDNAQREILIQKAIKSLEDNAFLSYENAEYIVCIVLEGVGVSFKKKSDNEIKEKTDKKIETVNIVLDDTIRTTNDHNINTVAENKSTSEEYLRAIVETNSSASRQEIEEIFEIGRKALVHNKIAEGVKFVQYAAKKSSMNASILLGYCYDEGIGLNKDRKIAEAYYRQGTISNPEFKSYYSQKYGIGQDLFEAAKKAAVKMLGTNYVPNQTPISNGPVVVTNSSTRVDTKQSSDTNVENKPKQDMLHSLKDRIFGGGRSKEENIWEIVNNRKRPTKEECAEILKLGRKLLKNGNMSDGIKLIKYTAQFGYDYGALLLAYCYDRGIGVSKDYNIATAYYNQAGVSGSADPSYKSGGWSDRTHRSRAASVAEKIYQEKI